MTLIIDSLADFTLENFRRVAWQAEPMTIGPQGRSRIEETRAAFMRLVDSDPAEPIYGVTTGFGDTAKTRLDAAARVVRGIVFARLSSFVSGYAAVSPDMV